MNRSDLIEALSLKCDQLLHRDVEAAVDIILESITKTLAADDRIEIRGFGAFALSHLPARIGRNPKSGEPVAIPAATIPRFKPGKELRNRVQFASDPATPYPG